jgi:hypothetical protein
MISTDARLSVTMTADERTTIDSSAPRPMRQVDRRVE